MKEEELLAVLRLQKTRSVGAVLAKKLIATIGNATDIFKEKKQHLSKVYGLGTLALQSLRDESNLRLAERELELINKHKIAYSYFLDEDYPSRLTQCVDGPILFFWDGKINLKNQKTLAVVGTRNMTMCGKRFCETLIEVLSDYQPVIISGYAYGVDICAHKAALKNNLQTVGVLAHGFSQIYPKVHKQYMHQVLENGGFITEFFYDDPPIREHFLSRNRIVAGLSEATIVIESAEKGGALVTADIANSYDREVFAVPGKATDIFSQGCNRLIQQHKAHLIQSAEDVISMLNWDVEKSLQKGVKQQRLPLDLNEQEQKIYDYLLTNGKQLMDVIALETDIPTYQLATVLLEMELKGIVNPLPGKQFSIS